MRIKTRRWNDPIEPDDGTRLLVCRFRPRGLRKADETWDEWRKDLAPTPELLGDFQGKHGPSIGWARYKARYVAEMRGQSQALCELARRANSGETLTLLCSSSCVDPAQCHRTVLRDLIEGAAKRRDDGRATARSHSGQ
jgi:uncharacterized protein YeaO (DUF488 family)